MNFQPSNIKVVDLDEDGCIIFEVEVNGMLIPCNETPEQWGWERLTEADITLINKILAERKGK